MEELAKHFAGGFTGYLLGKLIVSTFNLDESVVYFITGISIVITWLANNYIFPYLSRESSKSDAARKLNELKKNRYSLPVVKYVIEKINLEYIFNEFDNETIEKKTEELENKYHLEDSTRSLIKKEFQHRNNLFVINYLKDTSEFKNEFNSESNEMITNIFNQILDVKVRIKHGYELDDLQVEEKKNIYFQNNPKDITTKAELIDLMAIFKSLKNQYKLDDQIIDSKLNEFKRKFINKHFGITRLHMPIPKYVALVNNFLDKKFVLEEITQAECIIEMRYRTTFLFYREILRYLKTKENTQIFHLIKSLDEDNLIEVVSLKDILQNYNNSLNFDGNYTEFVQDIKDKDVIQNFNLNIFERLIKVHVESFYTSIDKILNEIDSETLELLNPNLLKEAIETKKQKVEMKVEK